MRLEAENVICPITDLFYHHQCSGVMKLRFRMRIPGPADIKVPYKSLDISIRVYAPSSSSQHSGGFLCP